LNYAKNPMSDMKMPWILPGLFPGENKFHSILPQISIFNVLAIHIAILYPVCTSSKYYRGKARLERKRACRAVNSGANASKRQ
jgi:hypothetical protein